MKGKVNSMTASQKMGIAGDIRKYQREVLRKVNYFPRENSIYADKYLILERYDGDVQKIIYVPWNGGRVKAERIIRTYKYDKMGGLGALMETSQRRETLLLKNLTAADKAMLQLAKQFIAEQQ